MYFVYIIKSKKDNKLYTGITNDLKRRIRQYNHGNISTKSTKNRGPFKLLYFEKIETRIIARKREKYFKSGVGREYIKKIVKIV